MGGMGVVPKNLSVTSMVAPNTSFVTGTCWYQGRDRGQTGMLERGLRLRQEVGKDVVRVEVSLWPWCTVLARVDLAVSKLSLTPEEFFELRLCKMDASTARTTV